MTSSSPPHASPEYSSTFDFFDIELDAGQDAVFHGGELISGFLKVQLKRPMTIEVIRLHFKGRGCFIERDGSKHEEKDKIYFDKNLTLLERPPGKPEPGHFPWIAEFMYSLPFEYTLPIGCPTSYEAVFGFIRYFVRAVIVEANTKNQFVAKQCFTVVAPSSGDEGIPESNPVTASEALTQGGCCCRAKICAEAQLQKSVFSPGEKVIGTMNLNSKHQKKLLDMIEVKLVDRLGKITPGKTQYASFRSIISRKLEAKELQAETLEFFKIPPVAPSLLGRTIEKVLPENTAMVESPSTLTLRARKKPFLRIEYEVQISIGGKLLLHLPITIVPPSKDSKFTYQPFVAGPQYVDDSDEIMMYKANDQGFTFTPLYPVLDPDGILLPSLSQSTAVCGEEEPEVLRESEKVECSQESEKPEKKVEDTKNQESEVISQPAIRELNVDSSVTEEIGPFGPEFYETVVLTRTADVEMMPLGINEQSARQTVKES